MSKKWLMLVMTLIVLLMTMPLLAACDDDEEETKTVQPTKTVEPTETVEPTGTDGECVKEEEFRLGVTGQVYGTSAEARDPSQEIAMDEINDAGGIRLGDTCIKFKYTFDDDKGTSSGAIASIQRLLYEFKADAILYTGSTAPPTLWRPYTEEEKAISFVTYPAEEWLGEEYPYAFYLQYHMASQPYVLFDWISKNRPDIKTVHGINTLSTANEDRTATLKKAAMPEYGIEYTGTEYYGPTTRDYYPVLTPVLTGDHPDALLIEYYTMHMVAKQAREMGFEGTFIVIGGVPDFVYKMMTFEELEGIISQTPSVESPLVPQYYNDYREVYKERKGAYPYSNVTFPSYLTPYYIAAAIKAAGTTDTERIKDVMETQTLTLEFPSGETLDVKMRGEEYYGINHLWSPPEYIAVIENGEVEVKEEIIPEQLEQYSAIYFKYQ